MVTSCIAYCCTNRAKKGSGISFHRVPIKGPDLLKKWIQAVRRKKEFLMETVSFVVHIFQSHASVGGKERVHQRLDKNAVPSIFSQFPKHLQIIEKKENHRQREK